MTHARTLTLDPTADPIHAAIARHHAATDAYQEAPSFITNDDLDAATDALVATPCASRFGALALLGHLRWWLDVSSEFAEGYQPAYRLTLARAADLTLFLGTHLPPAATPQAYPSGRMPPAPNCRQPEFLAPPNETQPGSIEPWQAVAAIRPDTAHVLSLRLLDGMGEALAAVTLICAGAVFIGLATLA